MTTLVEVRCKRCGKLLFRGSASDGRIEIVCQRCDTIQTVKLAPIREMLDR